MPKELLPLTAPGQERSELLDDPLGLRDRFAGFEHRMGLLEQRIAPLYAGGGLLDPQSTVTAYDDASPRAFIGQAAMIAEGGNIRIVKDNEFLAIHAIIACYDFVVESGGNGTHTTLEGASGTGALLSAVAAGGDQTIFMCNSETLTAVIDIGTTDLTGIITIIGAGYHTVITAASGEAIIEGGEVTVSEDGIIFRDIGLATDSGQGVYNVNDAAGGDEEIDTVRFYNCEFACGALLTGDSGVALNGVNLFVQDCRGALDYFYIETSSAIQNDPTTLTAFNCDLSMIRWWHNPNDDGTTDNVQIIGGTYTITTGQTLDFTTSGGMTHMLFHNLSIDYSGSTALWLTATGSSGPMNISIQAIEIRFTNNSGTAIVFANATLTDPSQIFIDGLFGFPSGGTDVSGGTFVTIGTDLTDVYVGDIFGQEFGTQYTGPAPTTAGLVSTIIRDVDGDTKVDVEETADEDIIHFDVGGTEIMTIAIHGVDIHHTAAASDEHALELEVDAAGFGDVKGIDVAYDTGAIATGQDEAVILINLNEIDATGGEVYGLEVLSTEGSATVYGMKVGAVVAPILQDSGTFANPTTGTNDTPSTDVAAMIDGSTGTSTTIFVLDNDYILIGAAAPFTEIEFIIETPASQPGIKPTFGYSTTGAHQFTTFTPVDGTNGFRNTGVVAWDAADLTGHTTNSDTGTFDIKIIRTHAVAGSVSLFFAKTAATVVYSWDKDGDVTIRELQADLYNFGGGDSTLTIASGDVTVTNTYHTIAGESGAADNLDGINGGSDGDLLVIRPSSDSVTITVRHNQSAAAVDNILLNNNSDIVLDDEDDCLFLLYDASLDTNGAWIQPDGSGGVIAGGAFHDGFSDFVAAEHLLVGAIDHDQLLNFAANEHFTEASISHDSIADVSTSDHHTKYTDAEAISAVEGEATLDLTGAVTIITAATALDIQNTTDAASNQVGIFRGGNRATAVDDDEAFLSFFLDDSGGAQKEFARLNWIATDVSAATEDAAVRLDMMVAGSLKTALLIDDSAVGNTALGAQAGQDLASGGTFNTILGALAGSALTTGDHNVLIGAFAGKILTTQGFNVFIGRGTGEADTGTANLFIGYLAGNKNTSAGSNAFLGAFAGESNTTGTGNTFIGRDTGNKNTTKGGQTYIGYQAGKVEAGGTGNTYLGYQSALLANGTNFCTAIGFQAGATMVGADFNTLIGYKADTAAETDGSIAIGYRATVTANNQLVIGSDNDSGRIADAYLGNGVVQATPLGVILQSTGGVGTDIAGSAFTLAGGKGTGNAAGGSLILQTSAVGASGTTLQSLTTRLTLDNAGLLTFADAVDMAFNATTGTKIGTASTQKIGFYGATPVVQTSHIVDADGNLADITTKFNQLLADMASLGLQAAS